MLHLFLSEPTFKDNWNDESYEQRKYHLKQLELVISSLVSSAGRSEARLWLCNTISAISSISPRRQRDLFVSLLRSKPINRHLAAQVLQLIFEKRPKKVGPIIAKRSYKLEKFFKGNPRRILEWFSNFSGTGDIEHGKGAKALSQFAFVNRDICWEELEWKGKHGQSPAMVATKPHYFLDLDVQRTVENFLEYVPDFWSSTEFSESLKDGDILLVDMNFFVDLFIDLMYKEELEEVWDVIEEFLMQQSFSSLCHRLLIVLEEKDLCLFLDMMPKYLKPSSESIELGNASRWFEIILSKYCGTTDIDQLLLLNAVSNQGRRLLQLVQEEGSEEEKEKVKNLIIQLCESSNWTNNLALIIEEDPKKEPLELVKMLGVQSWAIHVRLLQEFHTPESWEDLFASNGIKFHNSKKYTLLLDDEFLEGFGSDCDRNSTSKHKKRKKRRRRNFDNAAGSYADELVDFDLSHNRVDLQSKAGDWLLSTDDYSTTWSSVDLPEHISKHCFSTWLKWVFAKWRLVD